MTEHRVFKTIQDLFSSCIIYTLSEDSKMPLQSIENFSSINQSTSQTDHKIGSAGMYSGW